MTQKIKVLDHGFVRLVESWGGGDAQVSGDPEWPEADNEAGIIEAARQSTQGGFKGWENDSRLLKYLYDNKHSTPFEFAGMVIEVKAPIFIFRQWHRHRCVAPTTTVHFDQKRKDGRRSLHKDTIENLYRKFHSPRNKTGFPIEKMSLRTLNEDTLEIISNSIVDIFKSQPKEMVTVTSQSGKSITTSLDHRFFTESGWMTLEEVLLKNKKVFVSTTKRGNSCFWEPKPATFKEKWLSVRGNASYEVSNHGRVRNSSTGYILVPTYQPDGYVRQSYGDRVNRTAKYVHELVLEAFVGPRPSKDHEVSHSNHNRRDNKLSNLTWKTHSENCKESVNADRQSRLVGLPESIIDWVDVGETESYDLEVEGPFHNFIADGFVVHNSQSYNEMSARYGEVPNENYMPTVDRLMMTSDKNKQAGSAKDSEELTRGQAATFLLNLEDQYSEFGVTYRQALNQGVPKELARLGMPVGRYSQMRASTSLRNWLGFLTLRLDPHAQWEIQQFAKAVASLIEQEFPQTYKLFVDANPQ